MKSTLSGFISKNSGSINDCYTLLRLKGKRHGFSGFCASNSGSISQSFYSGPASGLDMGFALGGKIERCFFFTSRRDAKYTEKLMDRELWRDNSDTAGQKALSEMGLDTKLWISTGDSQVLAFRDNKWYCAPRVLSPLPANSGEREKISIESTEDLIKFAKRVNSRDSAAQNAVVTLKNNLDLGGKSWTPIGKDKSCAFRGSFDGKGHRISNFRINGKGLAYRGFFGVLEGGAYNLMVDCEISGGGTIGAFCAHLLGGVVCCCGAVSNIRPKGKIEAAGGFAGISTGVIAFSYASGRMDFSLPFILPIFIVFLAAAVSAGVFFHPSTRPLNNPVERDESQIPIPRADLPDLEETEESGGMHTISFSTSTEAAASLSRGKVDLVYQSTNVNADQKVKLQLKLSNGAVIAETGAIMPGYQITEMDLTAQAQTELTPGRYSAVILMVPYSIEDESKGFTETEVPITLTVSA